MFELKHKKQAIAYGIIGTDRFGYILAKELAAGGIDLLVAGKNGTDIRELREITINAMVIREYGKKALADAGFNNCDVVIVCLADMTDSILTTLNLGNMGIKKIISIATSAEHGEILQKLGAEVIYPEEDMAIRLASRFKSAIILDFVQLNEVINIFKSKVTHGLDGKTVVEANLRQNFDLNIIAMSRHGQVMEVIRPDLVFAEGDILFLAGRKEDFSRFNEWSEQNNDK